MYFCLSWLGCFCKFDSFPPSNQNISCQDKGDRSEKMGREKEIEERKGNKIGKKEEKGMEKKRERKGRKRKEM